MATAPVLRLKGIVKEYPGLRAVNNASLELLPGEVHGLVGENGAGKSTLIKIMAGVYERDSGSVVINGKEFERLYPIDAIREGIQSLREGKDVAVELAVARKRVVQRLVAALTNRDTMARQLAFLERHDLPRSYMIELALAVARLTPGDIEALIAAELDPAREVVVCIGDKARVAEAYRAADLVASPVE